MEGIKTNIDKLFDQFATDSLAYNVPKRQSSNYISGGTAAAAGVETQSPHNNNTSVGGKLAKKRKLSDVELLQSSASAVAAANDANNCSSSSTTAGANNLGRSANSLHDVSVASGDRTAHNASLLSTSGSASAAAVSFEVRRLRADVLDYSARVTQMKNELENRATVHSRMEYIYKNKVIGLEKQLESSETKLRDSDKHLKLLRRREAASQAEAVKAKHALAEQRCGYEEAVGTLQRAKLDAEEKLRDMHSEMTHRIAEMGQQYDELEKSYEYRRDEIDSLQDRCAQLQEKSRRQTELEANADVQKVQLSAAQRRVAELENEVATFGEWKDMSKTFQSRVARVPDLEAELERVRRENKNIYETIGNKLLLEEEVHDLRSRLAQQERSHDDAVALRTTIQLLEAELGDYKAVARDHCAPGAIVSPVHLRARIEEILRADLLLTSEKSEVRTEKESAAQRVLSLQKELEIFKKATENLQTSLTYHKTSMHRVQKKLTLVAKERDCYKQLIDNYEKDLTISGAISDLNPESQIRIKLEMVEKSLDAYKDMCANLEKDLLNAKNLPDLGLETVSSEHYERFKRDIAVLRQENEQLQHRKAELELMLEHSSLKGAYNADRYKVVHMSMNPAADAHGAHTVELAKLQAEIERLRRRNRQLEQDHEDMTVRLNQTVNMTCDLKEIGSLREQLKSLDAKNKHQKELYKQASQEFREVCYMLFGFRVDRIGANNYRISSLYAENENEYLNFRFESGGLDMLASDYSLTLAGMVNTYLGERGSLPAFLCSLNLELFNRTTVA